MHGAECFSLTKHVGPCPSLLKLSQLSLLAGVQLLVQRALQL